MLELFLYHTQGGLSSKHHSGAIYSFTRGMRWVPGAAYSLLAFQNGGFFDGTPQSPWWISSTILRLSHRRQLSSKQRIHHWTAVGE